MRDSPIVQQQISTASSADLIDEARDTATLNRSITSSTELIAGDVPTNEDVTVEESSYSEGITGSMGTLKRSYFHLLHYFDIRILMLFHVQFLSINLVN